MDQMGSPGGPPSWLHGQLEHCVTKRIPVALLLPASSPRRTGESLEHIRLLAESATALPPIIVHTPSMRVIDGMHRLRAAVLRGDLEIEAQLYDGADQDAFVLAVQANVTHGLPLSLADRRAAAARIIGSHPHWSDRMIASVVNLAPRTVGGIRTRAADVRLGRDGRARPVSTAAARQLAGELIAAHPEASLRQIARSTGLAPSTVLDVRNRLRSGQDPVPNGQQQPAARRNALDRAAAVQTLRADPSLRFSEAGRALLRWIDAGPAGSATRTKIVDQLPAHCVDTVISLAQQNAQAWQQLAEDLDTHRTQPVRIAH